jgi:hypothetical protein
MTNTKLEGQHEEPVTAIRTWRERIGANADFPLHAPTDVENAMVAEITDLRAQLTRLGLGGMVYQYRTRPMGGEWCPTWHQCSAEYYAGLKDGSHVMPGWEYEPRALCVVDPAAQAQGEAALDAALEPNAARFDRVRRLPDGSFERSYRGQPVAWPEVDKLADQVQAKESLP